jgi:hypothetical protein
MRVDRFAAVFEFHQAVLNRNHPNARFAYRSFQDEPILFGQPLSIHDRQTRISERDRSHMQHIRTHRDERTLFSKRIWVRRSVRRSDRDHHWKMPRLIPIDPSGGKNGKPQKKNQDNQQIPAGRGLIIDNFAGSLQLCPDRIRVDIPGTRFRPLNHVHILILRSGRFGRDS